jgi:protease-4
VAADRIYTSIEKLKKAKKLVYTSMGNIAASGGYYVALNSDKIFANPGTLTGAVGVISEFPNREGFQKLLGIQNEVLKTGKYMDLMSQNRVMTDEEKQMLEEFQEVHYGAFVKRVADNRNLTQDEVKDIAQGQVFTGKQALDLKMIDELGNFTDTAERMSKEADIDNPQLVFFRPQDPSLLSLIAGLLGQFF